MFLHFLPVDLLKFLPLLICKIIFSYSIVCFKKLFLRQSVTLRVIDRFINFKLFPSSNFTSNFYLLKSLLFNCFLIGLFIHYIFIHIFKLCTVLWLVQDSLEEMLVENRIHLWVIIFVGKGIFEKILFKLLKSRILWTSPQLSRDTDVANFKVFWLSIIFSRLSF